MEQCLVISWHKKKKNKPLTIVGNGHQTRDFIHVDDLTSAFVKIIKSNFKNKIKYS